MTTNQVKSQMNVGHQSNYNTFNYSTHNSGSPQNRNRDRPIPQLYNPTAETQRQQPLAQPLNPLYPQGPVSQTLQANNAVNLRNQSTATTVTPHQVLAENTTINE